jgi:hypothetical protein
MAEIAWRMFHAGNPGTPIVGPPSTRENARLYGRSILDTFSAGPPGPNAWHAPFGGDVAAAGRGEEMTGAQRLPGFARLQWALSTLAARARPRRSFTTTAAAKASPVVSGMIPGSSHTPPPA